MSTLDWIARVSLIVGITAFVIAWLLAMIDYKGNAP